MADESQIAPLVKEIAYPGKFSDALNREVDLTPKVIRQALDGTLKLMAEGYRVPGFNDHFTTSSGDVLGYWTKLWIDEDGSLLGLFEALDDSIRARVKKLDSSLIIQDDVQFGTRSNGLLTVPTAITRVDIVAAGAAVGTERFREEFAMAFSQSPNHLTSKSAVIYMAKGAIMADEKEPEEKAGGLMALLAAAFGLEGQEVGEDVLEKLFVNQVLGNPEDVGMAMLNLVKDGAAAMAAFGADEEEVVEELAENLADGDEAALMPPEDPEAAMAAPEDEEKTALRAAAMSGLLSTAGLDEDDKASIQTMFDEIFASSKNFMLAFNSASSLVKFRRKDPAIIALNTSKPSSRVAPAKRKSTEKPKTEEQKNFEIAMSSANPLVAALEKSGKLPKLPKDATIV